MFSGFKPVTLPVTNEEVAMVTRRQKALTLEINKIASMVRSGVYSNVEGENRSAFLRGEVANLEQYKRARRTTGTTSWKPAPRPTPRAKKPANKYVPPPVAQAEEPRVTQSQSPIDTGKAAPVHPLDNPYGKRYFGPSGNPGTNEITYGMKKATAGFFYRHEETSGGRKIFTWYGPTSPDQQTKNSWEQWNKMHFKKFYTHSFSVSKPAPPPVTPTSTAKKTAKDNPYGDTYTIPSISTSSISRISNASKIRADGYFFLYHFKNAAKGGRVYYIWYGPKSNNTQIVNQWLAWNLKHLGREWSARRTFTATPTNEPQSNPMSYDPALVTETAAKPSERNVKSNPYSYDYGNKFSGAEKIATKNNYIKHNGRYYGPKAKKTTYKLLGKSYTTYKSDTSMIAAWKKWNKDNNIKEVGRLFGLGSFTQAGQRRPVHDRLIDTKREEVDHARMARELALREESAREFNLKKQKESELRLKQQHRVPPQRRPSRRELQRVRPGGSRLTQRGAPPSVIREETMMRKRAGSTLRLDRPVPKGGSQSWEQMATKQEKDLVKMGLMMVGLPESPKLSEKGNQLMIKSLQISRIKNPQQQEKEAVSHFNATISELVNNSGYFAVKYRVEANPKGKQIKMTEMAGIAGGFTKTRNSMQGLLRQ